MIFTTVPVNTNVASLVPSPVVKDKPAVPASVKTPFATPKVTWTLPETASASAIWI